MVECAILDHADVVDGVGVSGGLIFFGSLQ